MTTIPSTLPPSSPSASAPPTLEDLSENCGALGLGCVKDKITGVAADVAGSTIDKALDGLADAMTDSVAWVVETTLTWWVDTPGLDVKKQQNVIAEIRGYLLPLAVAVLVGGLMVQGIRMALLRRADPMVRASRALLTFALVSGAGTAAVVGAMEAGDAFSTWVLDESTGGQFGARMTAVLTLGLKTQPGPTIALGAIALLASLVQAILLMCREAAMVALAGALVLAAAGKVTSATEGWFPRVTGWTLAVIAYKPTCSLVYATAFTLVKDGDNVQSLFVGYAMIILSIFALAPLTKLFSWAAGEASGGGGGGAGSMLMNAGFALQALGGMRRGGGGGGGESGGGWSAARHAEHMERSGPAAGGGAAGGRHRPSASPPGGGRPPGGGPGSQQTAGPFSHGGPQHQHPGGGGGAGQAASGGGKGGVAGAAVAAAKMGQQAGQNTAEKMSPGADGTGPAPPPPSGADPGAGRPGRGRP